MVIDITFYVEDIRSSGLYNYEGFVSSSFLPPGGNIGISTGIKSNSRNRLQTISINDRITRRDGLLSMRNYTVDPTVPPERRDISTSPYNVRVRIGYVL